METVTVTSSAAVAPGHPTGNVVSCCEGAPNTNCRRSSSRALFCLNSTSNAATEGSVLAYLEGGEQNQALCRYNKASPLLLCQSKPSRLELRSCINFKVSVVNGGVVAFFVLMQVCVVLQLQVLQQPDTALAGASATQQHKARAEQTARRVLWAQDTAQCAWWPMEPRNGT